MSDQARRTISGAAAKGVGLLTLVIAGYGIYLLVVGVTVVTTPAVPEGTPPAPASTETIPDLRGWIPITAGALILIGLTLRPIWLRIGLTWAGAVVASLFAVVFMFSIGGILRPVAAALLIGLGVLTWASVPRKRRPRDPIDTDTLSTG